MMHFITPHFEVPFGPEEPQYIFNTLEASTNERERCAHYRIKADMFANDACGPATIQFTTELGTLLDIQRLLRGKYIITNGVAWRRADTAVMHNVQNDIMVGLFRKNHNFEFRWDFSFDPVYLQRMKALREGRATIDRWQEEMNFRRKINLDD